MTVRCVYYFVEATEGGKGQRDFAFGGGREGSIG